MVKIHFKKEQLPKELKIYLNERAKLSQEQRIRSPTPVSQCGPLRQWSVMIDRCNNNLQWGFCPAGPQVCWGQLMLTDEVQRCTCMYLWADINIFP